MCQRISPVETFLPFVGLNPKGGVARQGSAADLWKVDWKCA